MKILHPNKKTPLPLNELNEYFNNGIYNIIDANKRERLDYFLMSFEEYRKSNNLIIKDASLYKDLPFSINTSEWKERQKDIHVINKLIDRKKQLKILDIGSWNGWLSNSLSKKGHQVTALNLFIDEYDGLLSKKKYETNFISIQIDVEEIHRIKDTFDLIIFNRNWAFFQNHQKIFNAAKKMLNMNGTIIFTGLSFYKNPSKIKNRLIKMNEKFKAKYNIPIIYNQTKGYLDFKDKLFFKENSILLNPYQKLKNLVKKILPKKAKIHYGYFIKK